MTLRLYDHQAAFVERIREAMRTNQSVMARAPCGYGKTQISAAIAQGTQAKGKRLIFAVHRRHLMAQTTQTFGNAGLDYGTIKPSGNPNPLALTQVAMVDTLKSRLDAYQADLLIVDEAHFAAAAGIKRVVDHYKAMGARILGLSASPRRLDNRPLGDVFDRLVHADTTRWLMDHGYLSDYIAYAPSNPDLSQVGTSMGDFDKKQLGEIMGKPSITGDAVTHWRRYAVGKRTIGYCLSREHSKRATEAFCAAGIPATHLDGESGDAEIKTTLTDFADGRVQVLFNCALLTEGLDISAHAGRDAPIEAIIMLRPTQSIALYTQMVGRALRRKDYPAVILDHAGNLLRHGLPDDEIDWSLTGKLKKKKEGATVPIKSCPKCFAIFAPAPVCPMCGEVFPVVSRKVEERPDQELQAIDREAFRRAQKREVGAARTLDDLMVIAAERGYKPGWAFRMAQLKRIPTHVAGRD